MTDTPCTHRWRLGRSLGPPQQQCSRCYEVRPFPEHKFRPKDVRAPDLSGRTMVLCRDCNCDREAAFHGPVVPQQTEGA